MCGTLRIMTNCYFTDISCLYFLYVGSFYKKKKKKGSGRGLRADAVRERDGERWSERRGTQTGKWEGWKEQGAEEEKGHL